MRKAILNRQREKQFDISYRITDQPLPEYDALKDPCLAGYFDKPQLKRHLKDMHIIKPKRKHRSQSKRPRTTSKSHGTDRNNFKLPLLDDMLGNRETPERREIRTAGTNQRKRKSMYHSKRDAELL